MDDILEIVFATLLGEMKEKEIDPAIFVAEFNENEEYQSMVEPFLDSLDDEERVEAISTILQGIEVASFVLNQFKM